MIVKPVLANILPLAALALILVPQSAHAEDCGNVDSVGSCIDSKTLVWCDDGGLETLKCGDGEICIAHENFGGAPGCIGTEYTDCGSISEQGQCAGDTTLVWCEASEIRIRSCEVGTVCDWVSDESWWDCVPASHAMAGGPPDDEGLSETETPEDADPIDGEGDDFTDNQDDGASASPTPNVEKGSAPPQTVVASGGAACGASGAGGSSPGVMVLLGLSALFIARRRARVVARRG